MASVAQLALRLGEQEFRRGRFMDRMAVRANHVGFGVRAPPDIRARNRLRVAAQAGIENFVRRQLRKRYNRRLAAASLDVSFARSMAAFASSVFWGFLSRSDALEMRIPIKIGPDVGMAGLANIAADVIGGLSRYSREQ